METYNQYGQRIGQEFSEWTKRAMPEKVALTGQYCNVVPLAVDHAEDLFPEWQSIDDDRDWTYLEDVRPKDMTACYSYLRNLSTHKERIYYAVQDKADQQIKGIFYASKFDPENGSFDIGGVNWTPLMKRTRISTESLYLVLAYFFDQLKYRRCEWRTSSYNTEAIKSAERIGFVKEGVLRDKRIRKGHLTDISVFSITLREWPAISSMITGWLREENFDGRSHQLHTLASFRRY
ncbi:GNAT family N-acetyltransferase [Kosakonia radicincitans]|uniref:GNAT family N-acetyltransferase n=1 Tax=Kosakonia radicincitans TaxID=283686 RepID=UPI0005C2D5AE|nr:GNAT family protein [Kosakonia radicincitans]KIS43858.1 acetyltransferase domain protein [Kosakonia radicincitans YD4]